MNIGKLVLMAVLAAGVAMAPRIAAANAGGCYENSGGCCSRERHDAHLGFDDGDHSECPDDAKLAAGTECDDDGNPCTDDVCDGDGGCMHPANTAPCSGDGNPCTNDQCSNGTCMHTAGNAGTVCRAAAGMCDLAETCTGTSKSCPADVKSTAVCRPSAGACDPAESCDGSHNSCPTDVLATTNTVCRASAGACDPAEHCTGTAADCPVDAKSSAVCRPAAGTCDVAESCDGVSNDCPTDAFVSASTTCRASAGICDPAEHCTGSSATCPPDAKSTALCRPATNGCDVAEFCDGTTNSCPADKFQPTTTTCDFGGTACQQGTCNGAGSCAFGFNRPAGTDCTDGLYCNGADTCNAAGACIHSGDPCPGTPCNTCQESSHSCFDPAGMTCDDGDACTLQDQCDGAGQCKGDAFINRFSLIAANNLLRLDIGTQVGMTESAIKGGVCAREIVARQFVEVSGDAVALRATPAEGDLPAALRFWKADKVGGRCVTGGGWVKWTDDVSVADGTCDMTGGATELAECQVAQCSTNSRYGVLASLTPDLVLPNAIKLRRSKNTRIPSVGTLGAGRVVVEVPAITIGGYSKLTLAGDASTTQVIVHVLGRLWVGRPGTIALEGLTPEQVLFLVDGTVFLHSFGSIAGTIYSPESVRLGLWSTLDGAVISEKVLRVGKFVQVQHHPFVGW